MLFRSYLQLLYTYLLSIYLFIYTTTYTYVTYLISYLLFYFIYEHILLNRRNVDCIYVGRHVISRSKKNKSPKYGMDILCHPVSGALESLLKSNHSLYYLYILKYVLVYSIWWSEALLWRPPFYFIFSQPAARLTNQVLVWDSQASTPLSTL